MNVNTSNIGIRWVTDTTDNVDDYTPLIRKTGCNEQIRSDTGAYLHFVIPKSYIDNSLKYWGISFDDYLDFIKSLGFNFEYYEHTFSTSREFLNDTFTEAIIFKIRNENIRKTYFCFCMLRHFYYYQDLIKKYLENTEEEDTEEDIINKLALVDPGCNTYISRSMFEYFTTFSDVLKHCLKQNNTVSYDNRLVTIIPKSIKEYSVYKKNKQEILKEIDDLEIVYKIEHLRNIPIQGIDGPVPTSGYILMNKKDLDNYIFQHMHTSTRNYKDYIIIKRTKVITGIKYQKKITVDIRSRHPSHNVFRNKLKSVHNVLIRLGSTSETLKKYTKVINSIESIRNSSNKMLMKGCFDANNVKTPEWLLLNTVDPSTVEYPCIVKNIYGSRGTGNYKIDNQQELSRFISRRRTSLENYILEKFYNYNKEYRIHVSTEGVFLMWRKVRRADTPKESMWFFNNQNCNWLSESNEGFDSPNNIEDIKAECVKALNAVGLDIGGVDLRVQNNYNAEGKRRTNPKFTVIEINSACSQAEQTSVAYLKEFEKLIK